MVTETTPYFLHSFLTKPESICNWTLSAVAAVCCKRKNGHISELFYYETIGKILSTIPFSDQLIDVFQQRLLCSSC